MGLGRDLIIGNINRKRQLEDRKYKEGLLTQERERAEEQRVTMQNILGQRGQDAMTPKGFTPSGRPASVLSSPETAQFSGPMADVPTEYGGEMTPIYQEDKAATGMYSGDPYERAGAVAQLATYSPQAATATQGAINASSKAAETAQGQDAMDLEGYFNVTLPDRTTGRAVTDQRTGKLMLSTGQGLVPAPQGTVPYQAPTGSGDNTQKLRKEFNQQATPFRDINQAYTRMKKSRETPSAAGDLAMIFNYMKMLDPGSVVRESEFATAAASGSLGDRFIAVGNKLMSGERLSDDMRDDFSNRADMLYAGASDDFERNVLGRYTDVAKTAGIDAKNIVHDFRAEMPEAPKRATVQDLPPGFVMQPDGTALNPTTGQIARPQ